MPSQKQVLDAYSDNPQIRNAINNYLSGNSYEYSKVGFLVGGKLMVFRRVSDLQEGFSECSFFHQIKNDKGWRKVPVNLKGENVFEQGI